LEHLPPVHALLVDDDPLILALLSAFLVSKGYTVMVADSGEVALELIGAGDFKLVITDWVMPGMDGLDLCRAVRALKGESYVYLIMLTSNRDEYALVNAMQAGVDDFLAKPFRPVELGARLHAAERVLALEADLDQRNRKLADAYGQLSRELELAKAMQLAMLPARARFDRVQFDWVFEASSYVGGDMFDYFRVDERHVCFYVIDVSGHGVSAAMLAFSAHHQLLSSKADIAEALAQHAGDICRVAEMMTARLNLHFMQMKETSLYLTMVYGLLDITSGKVALVQAGHPAPLHITAAGATLSIGDGGFPIGILQEASYQSHLIQLLPGSRLFVYSDGITDCTNPEGAFFSQKALEDVLLGQRTQPLEAAGAELRRALHAWKGAAQAYNDDVTLLSLAYH